MSQRFGTNSICYLVFLLGGCAGGGTTVETAAPPFYTLPSSLRGQTFNVTSATYTADFTGTIDSSLKDLSPNSTAQVSSSGDGIRIDVSETMDNGSAVYYHSTFSFLNHPELDSVGEINNFSYMAYGYWTNDIHCGSPISCLFSPEGGYFAFGVLTPGPAIPTTGQATYSGNFFGSFFTNTTGTNVAGNLTASADFAQRTVGLSTTNVSPSGYGFSGTLSYAAGINALSGPLSTTASDANGPLATGTANAHFYGPNAEEIGGAFRMQRAVASPSGTQNNTYVGSFGAKR